jgi:hypothetical protein
MKLCIEKGLNFGPIGFSNRTMFQLTRHPLKQFLAQKLITEMEQPPYTQDFTLNDFWLFPLIKSALKGQRFQDTEDIQKM